MPAPAIASALRTEAAVLVTSFFMREACLSRAPPSVASLTHPDLGARACRGLSYPPLVEEVALRPSRDPWSSTRWFRDRRWRAFLNHRDSVEPGERETSVVEPGEP